MKAEICEVRLLPRFLRLRDAPGYMNMTRSEFNRTVRRRIIWMPIGRQGVAFDRLDLDAWRDWLAEDGRQTAPSAMARNRWRGARDRARATGVPFTLTIADVEKLIRRARGRCEITSIPFETNSRRGPWTASLDRIDPAAGYTRDNCRMVCLAVNQAIGRWGTCVLYRIVEAFCPGRFSSNPSR